MPRIPLKKEHNMELYEEISRIDDSRRCFEFFLDLCSPAEMAAIEQRYEVAKMLKQGYVYTEISEQTRASSATISRVNRVLFSGTGVLHDVLETSLETGKGAGKTDGEADLPVK